ncbi:MAG: hypothetical protein AAGM22_07210 [Acidobacteriota bacterium]
MKEPEDLLWALPLDPDRSADTTAVPSDDELLAYRAGELEPETHRRLEARLAEDTDTRRRLARLAGVVGPRSELRSRVFSTLAAENQTDRRRKDRGSKDRRGRYAGIAAAAAVLLALGLGVLLRDSSGPPLPSYGWTVAGLVAERSAADGAPQGPAATSTTAYPSTLLTLDAAVTEGEIVDGVVYALFRSTPLGAERVPDASLTRQATPGAVRIQGEATAMLGTSQPGTYTLVLVVARRSADLPTPDRAAEDDPRGRWISLDASIELVPPP